MEILSALFTFVVKNSNPTMVINGISQYHHRSTCDIDIVLLRSRIMRTAALEHVNSLNTLMSSNFIGSLAPITKDDPRGLRVAHVRWKYDAEYCFLDSLLH